MSKSTTAVLFFPKASLMKAQHLALWKPGKRSQEANNSGNTLEIQGTFLERKLSRSWFHNKFQIFFGNESFCLASLSLQDVGTWSKEWFRGNNALGNVWERDILFPQMHCVPWIFPCSDLIPPVTTFTFN